MTEVQQYLADEVVIDYGDRLISRREALRRLLLLGVGLTSAGALLAACDRETTTRPPSTASPTGPSPIPSPVATEAITFAGPEGRMLRGAWAEAVQAKGGLLVIHENRGLNDHIRSVAGRFAANGYSSLAIDLLSEEGGTEAVGGEAEASAALGSAPPERFDADMKAGVSEIERRVSGAKIGVIGFCFGGGMVWRLLAAKETRLSAAAPFYGPLPSGADFTGTQAAVLAVYAELDSRVNASRDAAKAALEKAGLEHEIVTFPSVDHAFFNDTGGRYNAEQAGKAFTQTLEWFEKYL